MIRAKLTSVSSSRDDAIGYLYNKLDCAEWDGWERSGDITVTMTRPPMRAPIWKGSVTLIRNEY